MKTLTIKLTAPLQSYGNEATFARRTSGDYPSKSAIIGMVAAALGYRREDSRIIDLNQLHYAVRIDQPGELMTEFQTVEWKAETRKLTYRDLLQDAVFVVAIGSDDEALMTDLLSALRQPRFQLFLGRRANVPAGPLMMTLYDSETPVEVLQRLPWQAADWFKRRNRRRHQYNATIIADAELLPERPNWAVKDAVLSFSQRHREFDYRLIAQQTISLNNEQCAHADDSTQHDAFGAV